MHISAGSVNPAAVILGQSGSSSTVCRSYLQTFIIFVYKFLVFLIHNSSFWIRHSRLVYSPIPGNALTGWVVRALKYPWNWSSIARVKKMISTGGDLVASNDLAPRQRHQEVIPYLQSEKKRSINRRHVYTKQKTSNTYPDRVFHWDRPLQQ